VKARYEYDFVTVEPGRRSPRDAYRDIIEERAADGWRLVQVLPAPPRRFRSPRPVDLVFERPVRADGSGGPDVTVGPV
jgi:hypothetical protein